MNQFGGAGGLLPSVGPVEQLTIATGERADLIVDFSNNAGTTLLLRNGAKAPYPAGEAPDPQTTGQIMQFRVGTTLSRPDTTVVPATPRAMTPLTATPGAPVRDVKMSEILDPLTGFPTKLQLEDKGWLDRPVTLATKAADTEIWQLINTTADTNPMH